MPVEDMLYHLAALESTGLSTGTMTAAGDVSDEYGTFVRTRWLTPPRQSDILRVDMANEMASGAPSTRQFGERSEDEARRAWNAPHPRAEQARATGGDSLPGLP